MPALIFEELIPGNFAVNDGYAQLYEGPSTGGFPGGNPTNIIQTDQSWRVHFHWTNLGLLVPFMAGEWELEIYLEKMGPGEFGFPGTLGKTTVPFVAVNPHTYHVDIHIPPSTVPEGLYKLTACVQLKSPAGIPGPVVAFAELGAVKFYQA